MAEETRQRLKTGAAAARKRIPAKPPWNPLIPADLQPDVRVLAFDASLANVGWAVVWAEPDKVHVSAHGTIRPQARDDGYMGTWRRAAELRARLLGDSLFHAHVRSGSPVGVEAPLVGSGHRTESSLVAGLMVWQTFGKVAVVAATHVSAVLLGDPRVLSADRKKRVKAEVVRLFPGAVGRDYNEHERDAVSVALVMLRDMKEAP
jgi:Holliday junction resolvasome RuvABC endonuclease subunit